MRNLKLLAKNCTQTGWFYLSLTVLAFAQTTGGTTTTATTSPTPDPAAQKGAATASTKSTTQQGTMQTIVVQAVPLDEQVVPTSRTISSVYGDDMSIVDIPRSVNIITKQQLEDRQITSVQDLGQFASGTYTPAEYGLDGIPYIRGVYASLYQNGQQEIFFRNTVLIKWSRWTWSRAQVPRSMVRPVAARAVMSISSPRFLNLTETTPKSKRRSGITRREVNHGAIMNGKLTIPGRLSKIRWPIALVMKA
jgi:hypothetical protein